VCIPLPETPAGVEPGAVGTIFEELPSAPDPPDRLAIGLKTNRTDCFSAENRKIFKENRETIEHEPHSP
jgi:hypothetical protein